MKNPYDDFILNHLKKYGYFTKRNYKFSCVDFENTKYDQSPIGGKNLFPPDDENVETQIKLDEFVFPPGIDLSKGSLTLNMQDSGGNRDSLVYKPICGNFTPKVISNLSNKVSMDIIYDNMPQIQANKLTQSQSYHFLGSVQCVEKDHLLHFDSRFESGNLRRAVSVGDNCYELWMRRDIFTSKYTQWFYFSIKNVEPNVKYRFTFCNFYKKRSLFTDGVQPLIYSNTFNPPGWKRFGSDIAYYETDVKFRENRNYYALTFCFELPSTNPADTFYIASCYPYTYSDLRKNIKRISNSLPLTKICRVQQLCKTLAGNINYILTLTNPNSEREKTGVVLCARVHSGESNSSWVMQGIIDYLLEDSQDARKLRDSFVFKIIPMLNPDGVILGNYRCSLSGRDLNRTYNSRLTAFCYPTIHCVKRVVCDLKQQMESIMFCDIHGHSKKHGMFMYGCGTRNKTKFENLAVSEDEIFPFLLHKTSPDIFSFKDCRFGLQKGKNGTGRQDVWHNGVDRSYTMEISLGGSYNKESKQGFHFCLETLKNAGRHFLNTWLYYKEQKNNFLLQNEIEETKNDLELTEMEDTDSDSSVSDGPPIQYENFLKKKTYTKTKKNKINSADHLWKGAAKMLEKNQTERDLSDPTKKNGVCTFKKVRSFDLEQKLLLDNSVKKITKVDKYPNIVTMPNKSHFPGHKKLVEKTRRLENNLCSEQTQYSHANIVDYSLLVKTLIKKEEKYNRSKQIDATSRFLMLGQPMTVQLKFSNEKIPISPTYKSKY